jgi:hypothetical protein
LQNPGLVNTTAMSLLVSTSVRGWAWVMGLLRTVGFELRAVWGGCDPLFI